MYRSILETHPWSLHRGIAMIQGQDGLYLHDSVYHLLELDLPYAKIPRTRILRVFVLDILSPRFRLQYSIHAERQRSKSSGTESHRREGEDETTGDVKDNGYELPSASSQYDLFRRRISSERRIIFQHSSGDELGTRQSIEFFSPSRDTRHCKVCFSSDSEDSSDEEEEHADYQDEHRTPGDDRRIIIYSLLASGIVGYSTPARERAWKNEIDMHYHAHVSFSNIISTVVVPRSIYHTGRTNKLSDKKVIGIYVGQLAEYGWGFGNAVSLSIYPSSSFLGIRNVLDLSNDELQEMMYASIGRSISYSGAIYNLAYDPSELIMVVSPTTDKGDPLSDLLKSMTKTWDKLLTHPTECPLPDPPLETRDNRNVSYEIPPTNMGGQKILTLISKVLNDGVVMYISASDRLLPAILSWAGMKRS